MNIYESQIERMKRLMDYGNNSNDTTNVLKTVVEYHAKGADGKTYGIIRENNKFYIKVAPKKDTEIVAEDYDYIGGFINKKKNEFDSYAKASKEFDLKLMSLKEAYSSTEPIVSEYKKYEQPEWEVCETKEMKEELKRQKEIMLNASILMNEGKNSYNHDVPEAPATNPSEKTKNAPFTDKSKAELDKDFEKTSDNHETAGEPFNNKENVSNSDMEDDKNKKGGSNVNSPNTEKAKFAPENSIANQHPKGAKSVKMNEAKKIKVSESQVLAWSDCADYMDKSSNTEIGSSEPFGEKEIKESGESMHDKSDNINSPKPGNGEIGSGEPFDEKINEDADDYTEYEGMPDEDEKPFPEVDDYSNADLDFENDYNEWLDKDSVVNYDDYEGDEYDGEDFDTTYGFDNPYESKKRKGNKISEGTVLNDFGKHPAYQKKVMTTPPNVEVTKDGYKDWNDDSVKGDKPFGLKIGSSAPFDEIVKIITDSVMSKLEKSALKKK